MAENSCSLPSPSGCIINEKTNLQLEKPLQQKKEIQSQPLLISAQNPLQNQSDSPIEQQESQDSENDSQLFRDRSPKLDQQNSNQNSNRIQTPNKNNNFNPSSNDKIPSCHCKKSKCLKMYCDCFAKGNKCRETCKCIGCQNTKNLNRQKKPDCQNDEQIQKSQDSNKKSLKLKERSCNCKKSFCLKKYCECYNANVPCTQVCKCQDCKNNGENNGFRDDKIQGSVAQIDPPFSNGGSLKVNEQAISEPNVVNQRKEEYFVRKGQKLDEDEIETKIQQILKLVPQHNYQTMLDFLAYCLS